MTMNRYLVPGLVLFIFVGLAYLAPSSYPRPSNNVRDLAFNGDRLGMAKRELLASKVAQGYPYSYINFNEVETVEDVQLSDTSPLSPDQKIGWIFNADSGRIVRYWTEVHMEPGYSEEDARPRTVGYVEIRFPNVKLLLEEQLPFATIKERLAYDPTQDNDKVKTIRVMSDGVSVESDNASESGKIIVVRGRIMDVLRST